MVEHGYSKGPAEAIPAENQKEIAERLLVAPDSVSINTVSMEIDMLSEIEAFCAYFNWKREISLFVR